ncbi:unnamed protein product, partial [Mesorhabditis belari]|uniref:Uncharacterized protein n=1 Tax=Mesorhabditis belari TaxID=2138241 RepID=A0AAF3FD74_9BILA
MFFRFVDKSTILAQFALYLQFSGYVAIGIGTILMSLSRVTLVWAPIRTRFLWTANVMRILVFTQNFIAYAHALPCFFAQISFLPMGQEKFIAFPTSTALVERLLAYSTAILLLVFSVSCVDQVFVYLGRLFPASGLATLGLTMMHYSMDIHLFFTTFSPWLIHRTLRTKALGWSIGKASQTDVGHPQAIRTVTQHPQQRTINIDERNSRNTLPKLSIQTSFPNFISKKPDD